MTNTIRITGNDAINYVRLTSTGILATYADATSEAREAVSIEEARCIASEDPSLVYLDLPAYIVRELADEAADAGDDALATSCASALSGDAAAQRLVGRALVAAAAQSDAHVCADN